MFSGVASTVLGKVSWVFSQFGKTVSI